MAKINKYGILALLVCFLMAGCSEGPAAENQDNPYTPSANPSAEPSASPSEEPSQDPSAEESDPEYDEIIARFTVELNKIRDMVEMSDRDVPISDVMEEEDIYTIVFGDEAYTFVCDVNAPGVPDFGVTFDGRNYLWTIDGKVLSTSANVLTGVPSVRVAGGKWQVSYGSSPWQTLDTAVSPMEIGNIVLFTSVEVFDTAVYFYFSDGSYVSLPIEEDEDEPSHDHQFSDDPSVDPEDLTVSVNTGAASDIAPTSVKLSGSFYGANQIPTGSGFEWGRSQSSLTGDLAVDKTFTGASGSFSASLGSLESETTYYYRAYVIMGNAKYFFGGVKSFTTSSSAQVSDKAHYLGCYEMPAMDLSGSVQSGSETHGSTKYYSYGVNTSGKQIVVTHTYKESGHQVRNYTVLFDGDKHCPLWSAFVMQDDAYPDDGIGRTGSWKDDPAVPSSWQQGGVSGYSRGHHVASNYRQSNSDGGAGNKQTFYHTNQSPQFQNGFNDGVWNNMEQAIKAKAPSGRDTLYVTVGTLFENGKTIGDVSVPSHFYTCLMYCTFDSSGNITGAKGEAYIYDNISHKGKDYKDFRTSIDAIEQRSGFNFFANVPDRLQTEAEKTTSGVL